MSIIYFILKSVLRAEKDEIFNQIPVVDTRNLRETNILRIP